MKWYPYGHDFGNADMGGVTTINGSVFSRTIPTAFTKVDTNAMRNLGISVEDIHTHVMRFNGETMAYAVGELALQQSMDAYHGRGDIQRYASKYSLRGLLTIAALLIPEIEFGLHVVTGLPAETYIKNMDLRRAIKESLDGVHVFTLDNGKTWRRVTIEVATVVMEGAGALIAYGEKGTSKLTESAVIDLGGRTTDLYVARGQVPMTEYCKGKPLGVEVATQMLMDTFEAKFNRPLSLLEGREVMYSFVSKGKHRYPELTVYGKTIDEYDLASLVQEAINQMGSEIVSFVASTWRQSDRDSVAASFNPVLCIGGGVYYFYDYVKKRIPHLTRPDDPIHANALGYCNLAGRLLMRKAQAQTASGAAASTNGVKATTNGAKASIG